MENQIGFTPLFERVLILPDSVETKTETGIILPPEARQRPTTGTIISLGHIITEKTPIKAGDRVVYQKYSGLDFKWEGRTYHIVMVNDLLGTVSKDDSKFQLSENV